MLPFVLIYDIVNIAELDVTTTTVLLPTSGLTTISPFLKAFVYRKELGAEPSWKKHYI